MVRSWRLGFSGLLIAAVVASCAPGPNAVRPTGNKSPKVTPTAGASLPPGLIDASTPPGIGGPSTPVIQPSVGPVAPVITNNGAGLIGKVKAPAQLISDKGLGLIGNNGSSYRVFSVSENPVPGAEVRLKSADGTYVKNDKGEVLKAITDAAGAYRLPFSGNTANLLVEVTLPGDKGAMTALVPRGESTTDRTVDVNFSSTLVMTYILDQYVKGDPKVLDKLPAEVEQTTRTQTDLALAGGQAAIPEALTTAVVVETVNLLRQKSPGLNNQMEVVKKLLVAGLSDQANGLPAKDIETDAVDVAIGADGTVYFAGQTTLRIWKKDAAGNLVAIAGSGVPPSNLVIPQPTQPAPGDGEPALKGLFLPQALEILPDGKILILDRAYNRIRQIDTAGMLSTYVASADWGELRDMTLEPDGSLVVATHSAVFRVAPDKTITRIAGEVRQWVVNTATKIVDSGDGGSPLEAKFQDLQSIAARGGTVYTYDYNGRIRRISGDKIEAFAGTGVPGYSGDGGPATAAQLHRIGGMAVREDGGVLIGDAANHRLRLVLNGTITTLAGTGSTGLAGDNGPALSAALTEPRTVRLAANGTVFFTDAGFVRKVENGVVSTLIGGLQVLEGKRPVDKHQFMEPSSVRYDAARHALVVCDVRHMYRWTLADNMIEVLASSGPAGDPFVEGAPAKKANLVGLRSPILEADGSISLIGGDYTYYVPRVFKIKDGAVTTMCGGKPDANAHHDLPVLDADLGSIQGNLVRVGDTYYYTMRTQGYIRTFTEGGTTARFSGYGTAKTDGTLAKDFDFTVVTVIEKAPDGALIVADLATLYRIDLATQQVTRIAGTGEVGLSGDGGPATSAKIGVIDGIAFDAQGRMYLSDPAYARIRRINTDGTITSVAGTGTSVLGGGTGVDSGLVAPTGLAFDKDGNLYVVDSRHNQIKIIRANQL